MKTQKIGFQVLGMIFIMSLMFTKSSNAQSKNGWIPLGVKYTVQDLSNLIIPQNDWQPYPSVQNPDGFNNIPDAIKQEYIKDAEQLMDVKWPRLPATTFLEYVRTGNRSHYQDLSFKRRQMLAKLVLAESFERKGRFIDQIINGVWAICEESFWGVPAHLHLQEEGHGLPNVQHPVVDLFAAETGQEMAWTYYLLKPELDKVNPLIAKRIAYEANRRILKPYLEREDWGYMGFEWRKNPNEHRRVNNWNPWINSNVLSTALILSPDRQTQLKLVHKTMESVDNFVIPYPADGSSDEGPQYWGRAAGSLLDYLEVLKSASGGKINYFNQSVVKKMGEYIYKMNISYPYFVNYGDADAIEKRDPALLYRFGKETNDSQLKQFAAFELQEEMQNGWADVLNFRFGALNRALPALMSYSDIQQEDPKQPLLRHVWFPDIQVFTARAQAGSKKGFYIMAKGGENGASHNHNDVGNYIVYCDGNPVLVDAGAHTYSAKTFSSQRYQIWNYQSRYHNLPDINGAMEQSGSRFKATDVSAEDQKNKAVFKVNLASAYPDSAYVKKWNRTLTLHRGKAVELTEDYILDKFVQPLTENFLTPFKPDLSKNGQIILNDPDVHETYYIKYDKNKFEPAYEAVTFNDERMSRNWGHVLYHISLHSKIRKTQDRFTINISN
ncbi:MAG TPA: heparinase II/III family protein [Balneolaceae bacterium]|nr:heparinase II/III family protein [Balneolaceae bacterium]